jgi:TRAP-type C4-dicarboxylate transport system permease small subunit
MFVKILDRTLDASICVVLAAMVAIVAINVFCRFVLNFSLYWGDESAQALLVWLTFLGSAVAVRERGHYSFDYLARVSPPRMRLAVALTSRIITLLAIFGLFYWSAEVAIGIRPWIMPALQISRTWVYAAGPIGCLFMLVYGFLDLRRVIREHQAVEEPFAAI